MSIQRKLSIALAVSVALNLFFGGFVVARMVMHRSHAEFRESKPFGPHPFAGPRGMMGDLDDPKLRKPIEQLFEGRRETFERDRQRIRDARQQVAAALAQEPFDAKVLEAAFNELREATTSAQANLHQGLIDAAPSLPNEARRKLIKKWTKGPKRGPHHDSD